MLTLLALVVVALPLHAKDKPAHERGVLMQVDSSSRSNAEKDNKTLAGEILPTDSLHKHKLLRMVESEDKEREYVVISMTPRREAAQNQSASANPVCWPSGFNPA